MKLVQASKMIQ